MKIPFLKKRITENPTAISVVRIIDRLNIGGPAKHVTWLASEMNPAGFNTVLVTGVVSSEEGDMSYFARAAGVNPIVIKEMSRELGFGDIITILRLTWLYYKLKPQIIHTHKAKAGAVGRLAAMIYRWGTPSLLWLKPRQCKIVHTFHGHIFHSYYGKWKTRFFILIEQFLARFCTDIIIAISRQQRQEINGTFCVGRAKQFRVIPLGIDLAEKQSVALRAELGLSNAKIVIGIVGRLCEVKNHSLLLQAFAELIKNDLSLELVIIGDGNLRSKLVDEVRSLGISEKVHFTGFRSDAASLYTELDIVALSSLNEGTPLTLIEAMSCGRPVIATEVGGVSDIMGKLFEAKDDFKIWEHGVTAGRQKLSGYVSALRYLIENPKERREMGSCGKKFVHQNLAKDQLIVNMAQLYSELLA